jgi:hypothetical protein
MNTMDMFYIIFFNSVSMISIGTLITIGHKCPESGVWKVLGILTKVTAPLAKGDTMPPYCGFAVSRVCVILVLAFI